MGMLVCMCININIFLEFQLPMAYDYDDDVQAAICIISMIVVEWTGPDRSCNVKLPSPAESNNGEVE